VRIAIVGAGISGLTVAHLLHRDHEIVVFEAGGYAGGHTNTVRVDTPNETHHVDTGFIVFNDRNYPNFERLLRRIGVASQPSSMSFAVTDEQGDFEYASTSANGLFAKRAHLASPRFHRMLADVVRFQRAGRELLGGTESPARPANGFARGADEAAMGGTHALEREADEPAMGGTHALEREAEGHAFGDRTYARQRRADEPAPGDHTLALARRADGPSLGAWVEELGFSRAFIDKLIVPQASAVWSADPRQMWTFPARFLVEFFANHGMLGMRDRPRWRTVSGGSAQYVERLTKPFRHRLHLQTPVQAIHRRTDHVLVKPQHAEPQRFDEVVLATHSDQALKLLADASDREHELLRSIPYQPNEAVLHTDRRLLPRRRRAWASWNYHLLDEPPGKTTVTYHMNRLQSLKAEREFCVTLNHTEKIDPAEVIRKIDYSHPVYTPEGAAAQARHAEISGAHTRTHYCGAYWGWGFHEDGVVSGLRVAERWGATLK
jgi:predicted NAD/FAD-binding protein